MPVKVGSADVASAYLGSTALARMYHGADLVWSGAVEPVDPATLNDLYAWWDVGDEDTVTAINGTHVNEVADKSVNGLDLRQSTESLRPLLDTVNGLGAIRFDSAARVMRAIGLASDWKLLHDGSDVTVFVVCKPAAGSVDLAWVMATADSSSDVGMDMRWRDTDALRWLTLDGAGNIVLNASSPTDVADGEVSVASFTVDSGEAEWQVYGGGSAGTSLSTSPSSNPDNNLHVGNRPAGDQGRNMTVCELVICDAAVDAATTAGVREFLAAKWGVS